MKTGLEVKGKSAGWMGGINRQPTTEIKSKRRRPDSALMARVTIEAMKEGKTICEIMLGR